ncbi:hypothetical protein [Actinomadura verrucosospora]|uniref:Histidyl-tRNA synthetase n=1 Tax=Actinomadura verrucosospora TaxID=46165 RepID=A0A7D4AQY3_ACTVE|nr:hypothetical protein [Actinomadura verrucosospora]QKG22909.1 histidyl-tRNA synthetase [Actinomadura verrucosospora]
MSLVNGDQSADELHGPEKEPYVFLERLAMELNSQQRMRARTERTAGGAWVRVVNPKTGWFSERVKCYPDPLSGNVLCFWWEWGSKIGTADDVPGSAAVIARVLDPEPELSTGTVKTGDA